MALMESQVRLKTGDVAPDFELMGIDDKMHKMSSYDARGYLVIFMCNHCPYVKAKSNALNELYGKFGKDIAVIGINSNDSVKYPDDSYESMKQTA
ncbi:MAG: thioredoxin family protein, partial [Nitrosopumilus sp. B06]